jgi:hypothetical protein
VPQPNPTTRPTRDPARTSRSPSVKWRTTARVVIGVMLTLLGLLWILQGADVLQIRPLLCVAECQPLTGGSAGWLAIGAVTLVVGLGVTGVLRRRARRHPVDR